LIRLLLIVSFFIVTIHSEAQTREIPGGVSAGVVRLYPNPATTVINFDIQKSVDKAYSLQIYSFMGARKMFEQTNLTDKTSINLSDFNRGVYIYQLRDRSGKLIESGKFQVSK